VRGIYHDVELCKFNNDPSTWEQVIGGVGFGKSFGSLASLDHPAEHDVFKALAAGKLLRSQAPIQAFLLHPDRVS
jgi:hypothetical protein